MFYCPMHHLLGTVPLQLLCEKPAEQATKPPGQAANGSQVNESGKLESLLDPHLFKLANNPKE